MRLIFILILLASGLLSTSATWANTPLKVRNLSPVVQLFGTPRMLGSRISEHRELNLNLEIANNFQSQLTPSTFAFFDGETYLTTLSMTNPLNDQWSWSVEVPYINHLGGGLDGLVDEFHELFGLPDGNRSAAPRGRLDYFVSSNGVTYVDFDDSRSHLADVRVQLARQLQSGATPWVLRGEVKLPTGKVDNLSGSEGLDLSVWLEHGRTVDVSGSLFNVSLGGGFTWLGEGEFIPEQMESWAGFAHFGVNKKVNNWLELHGQLDAHTALLDTGNPLAADGGVLGTLGGRVLFNPHTWLDLAIIEDLENESASDVIFQFSLHHQMSR